MHVYSNAESTPFNLKQLDPLMKQIRVCDDGERKEDAEGPCLSEFALDGLQDILDEGQVLLAHLQDCLGLLELEKCLHSSHKFFFVLQYAAIKSCSCCNHAAAKSCSCCNRAGIKY